MRFFTGSALASDDCAGLPTVSQVVELDERFHTVRSYQAERDARQFALFAYRNIADDVVTGHGPYLETLNEVFKPICSQPLVLLWWLRQLMAESQSPPEFSRRIAISLATGRRHPT